MAIQQPISSDTLNSPDHSLSHRVFANDNTAPVQSVIVDSAGNVGINTTAPSGKLEIVNSANTNPQLVLSSQVGNGISANELIGGISFYSNDPDQTGISAQILTKADGSSHIAGSIPTRLEFYTTPTSSITPTIAMTIDRTGAIGVGTGVPTRLVSLVKSTATALGALDTTTTFTNPDAGASDNSITSNISLSSNQTTQSDHYAQSILIRTAADATTYHANSQIRSFSLISQHRGSASYPDLRGLFVDCQTTGAGGVTTMRQIDIYGRNTGAGNIGTYQGIYIRTPANSGGGAITNLYGIQMDSLNTGTNVKAIHLNVAAGANKFNMFVEGTAINYFAGAVGCGTYSATARVHIAAGTATASTAPLKLTQASAVVLTTPEAGAIECNDGDLLYYTIKTGPTRKTIAFTDSAITSSMYIGTTQVALNRASAALTLAGITLTTPDIGVATATSVSCSPTISSGTSAPATTPTKVGDIFVDTTGKKMYVATGTTNSSDWTILN
jgi:hypothetical protein